MENSRAIVNIGPIIIAIDSILCGIKAKRAKNGIMYQSGVGEVCMIDGSGWLVSAGGPKNIAKPIIAKITKVPKIVSRHAAFGQKGTPFS
ncbi:MAG TPA: hypothetical protein VFD44_05245, partial [Hanamia sp.]|nr:hypothetical protein [Hanamia sp.]